MFCIVRYRRKLKNEMPTSLRIQGWGLRFMTETYQPLYQKRFGKWVRVRTL